MSRCFQADAPHPSRLEREINHRSSARGMGRRGLAIRHRLRICAGHRHRRRRVWESRRWKQDPLDQDPDPVGVGPAILRERQPAKVYERAQKRILVRNPALCSAYAGRTFGRAPGPRNLKRRHRHYRDVLGGRPDPRPALFRLVGCAKASGLAALGISRVAPALCDFASSNNWRRGSAPCENDRNRVMRADCGRALFIVHRRCPRLVQWVNSPGTRAGKRRRARN
jgi:hypothetical protein